MKIRQSIIALTITSFIILIISACSTKPGARTDAGSVNEKLNLYADAEAMGWRLAVHTYTLRRFTLEEALDKIQAGGFKYVEAFRNQVFGAGSEERTHFSMSPELREKMKHMVEERGLKLVNFGVAHGETEEEWRQLFEFAKHMGIETINSEPAPQFLDLVDQLANEYEINVAIHNHPIPTRYYHPDSVLNALEGRSARMGVCGDIGHWVRSGLDPIECIKKLEGRLMSFHFKDLSEKSRDAHDVIWGNGVSNVEGILKELKRQEFKGVFTIEYEHNWDNNMPEVIASAKYFNEVAASLRK